MDRSTLTSLTIPRLREKLVEAKVPLPPAKMLKADLVEYCMQNLPRSPARSPATGSPFRSVEGTPVFKGRPEISRQSVSSMALVQVLPPRPLRVDRRVWVFAALLGMAVVAASVTFFGRKVLPLCDNSVHSSDLQAACAPCPQRGICAAGRLTSCSPGYRPKSVGIFSYPVSCEIDSDVQVNGKLLADRFSSALARQRGEQQCKERDSANMEPADVKKFLVLPGLTPGELDAAINAMRLPDWIVKDRDGVYWSLKGDKPIGCRVAEWWQLWKEVVIMSVLALLILALSIKRTRDKKLLRKSVLRIVRESTGIVGGRLSAPSVLDLMDGPLQGYTERQAGNYMRDLSRVEPDIECSDDLNRGGALVFWSRSKLRDLKRSE